MKKLPLFAALCLALPLCAAELAVNAPATDETLTNDQTLSFDRGVTVAAGDTVIVSATLTMTLPSDAVDQSAAVEGDKLVVTADADGSVLVYAGGTWYTAQGLTVTEGDTLDVQVTVKGGQDAVGYVVTLTKGTTTSTVEASASDTPTTFSALALSGEGSATGLAVAAVPQGILPAPPEGGTQDAELVTEYVTWLNAADKGGAMPEGASDGDLSDAFAMNVGGTPSLAITDIDVSARTITVSGSYAKGEGEEAVDMGAINGTIYLTYASELGGQAKTAKAEVSVQHDKTAVVNLPDGAVFVKARVALTPPADTTL